MHYQFWNIPRTYFVRPGLNLNSTASPVSWSEINHIFAAPRVINIVLNYGSACCPQKFLSVHSINIFGEFRKKFGFIANVSFETGCCIGFKLNHKCGMKENRATVKSVVRRVIGDFSKRRRRLKDLKREGVSQATTTATTTATTETHTDEETN